MMSYVQEVCVRRGGREEKKNFDCVTFGMCCCFEKFEKLQAQRFCFSILGMPGLELQSVSAKGHVVFTLNYERASMSGLFDNYPFFVPSFCFRVLD